MKHFILFLIFILNTFRTIAQWESTNGPYGATGVNDILETESGVLFAATNGGGIYRSADGGLSWNEVNEGVVSGVVSSMSVNSNGVLFAADSGVMRSFNEGASWERCNNGIDNLAISSLAANSAGLVFAAAYSAQGGVPGVYVSADNGDNWVLSTIGTDFSDVIEMGVSADGIIFIGSNGYLKRSLDNGQTWTDLDPGIGSNYIIRSFDFESGIILMAAGNEGGILRSEDNGDTWQLLSAGDITAVSLSSGGEYYAGVNPEGVLYSDDNGITWSNYLNGLPHSVINDLFALDGTMLAATSGVYRFNGDGSPWTWSSQGITAASPGSMAVTPNGDLFALTEWLWQNTGGQQWNIIGDDISDGEFGKIVIRNDTLYLSAGPGLFMSVNGGQEWDLLSTVDTTIQDFDVNPAGHLFLMTWKGLLRSVDKGNTWDSLGFAGEKMYLMISDVTGTLLLSDDYPSLYLYRSDDNGDTWNQSNPLGIMNTAEAFAEDTQGDIFIATTQSVIRSTDDGITWEDITPVGITGNNTCITSDTSGRLFLSGKWGLLQSPDRGETWNDFSQGLQPWGWIESIIVSPDGYLYAGYNAHSVWRREVVTGSSHVQPDESLKIFPNPASGIVIVTIDDYTIYARPQRIKINDLTGKLVKEVNLTGNITQINVSDLLSGIYIFSTNKFNGTIVAIK